MACFEAGTTRLYIALNGVCSKLAHVKFFSWPSDKFLKTCPLKGKPNFVDFTNCMVPRHVHTKPTKQWLVKLSNWEVIEFTLEGVQTECETFLNTRTDIHNIRSTIDYNRVLVRTAIHVGESILSHLCWKEESVLTLKSPNKIRQSIALALATAPYSL